MAFVVETLRERLHVEGADAARDDTVLGTGGLELDSVSLLELVSELEERYGVAIGAELDTLMGSTVGDLVRMVREGSGAESGVTRQEIADILAEVRAPDDAPADDYTAELTLDSYSLVWLLHALEERHGVVVDVTREDLVPVFTSVDRIHDYVATHGSRAAAS